MKYLIKPFLIYNLPNKKTTIIQTRESSFATKDVQLINFLKYLEEYNISEITNVELTTITKNEEITSQVISFLLENNIAAISKDIKTSFREIFVYSNDISFIQGINFFTENDILTNQDLEDFGSTGKQESLIILALNPFSIKELKKLVNNIPENSTNIYKIIFPYNNALYISNYYSPEWGNPCPLCFFYSLEAQLRGSQTGKEFLNFQLMVDLFYKEKSNFIYEGLLEKKDWLPVLNFLYHDLSNKDTLFEKIDDVTEIDFTSHSVTHDTSYHWEMCDCYE